MMKLNQSLKTTKKVASKIKIPPSKLIVKYLMKLHLLYKHKVTIMRRILKILIEVTYDNNLQK